MSYTVFFHFLFEYMAGGLAEVRPFPNSPSQVEQSRTLDDGLRMKVGTVAGGRIGNVRTLVRRLVAHGDLDDGGQPSLQRFVE